MKQYHLVKDGKTVETFSMLDDEDLSDGFHTFSELYAHRRALTAVLAAYGPAWRSQNHHPDDDPMFDGYFIVGIELSPGPISYHYELKYWDDFDGVPELAFAPKWDGHTADDVVKRLKAQARETREIRDPSSWLGRA